VIEFVPTICPYCAVECGMMMVVKRGHVDTYRGLLPGHPFKVDAMLLSLFSFVIPSWGMTASVTLPVEA
jgi:hypothetical protein